MDNLDEIVAIVAAGIVTIASMWLQPAPEIAGIANTFVGGCIGYIGGNRIKDHVGKDRSEK